MHFLDMDAPVKYTTCIKRNGKWFIATSPEYPKCNGQGLAEEEATDELKESITIFVKEWLADISKSRNSGDFLSYHAIYPPGMPTLKEIQEARSITTHP